MKTQENLPLFRGELALLLAVLVNSFGVVLMLYSGAGISPSPVSLTPFPRCGHFSPLVPGPICSRPL